jgi:hypothetical protein
MMANNEVPGAEAGARTRGPRSGALKTMAAIEVVDEYEARRMSSDKTRSPVRLQGSLAPVIGVLEAHE